MQGRRGLDAKRASQALIAGLFLLASCAGVPWIQPGLEFAGNLLSAAAGNYAESNPDYVEIIKSLVAGYSSADSPYTSPPTQQAPASEHPQAPQQPLAMEIALVRQEYQGDRLVTAALVDGGTLHGSADPATTDRFLIHFRASVSAYVYILAIDGSGWAQALFPSPLTSISNPVQQGVECTIPESSAALGLDETRGVQTIYFLVSRTRRADIEDLLSQLDSLTRPEVRAPHQVTEPALIERGLRGRGQGLPASVQTRSGENLEVASTSYFAGIEDPELVISRWFWNQ